MAPRRVFRSSHVVTPAGARPATVHVLGERIERVSEPDDAPAGVELVELGDVALMPGIVDTHVHVNEPGRTEWEGFVTATRAAAKGGATTIVDMPLNSIPPVTTLHGFEAKLAATEGKLMIDVGLAGGAVPGNAPEIRAIRDAGARFFKCFLCESGVPEFPHLTLDALPEAMRALADSGATLLAHAELPEPLELAAKKLEALPAEAARRYRTYLESRPKQAENLAVEALIRLAKQTGTRTHVVHLSSAEALESLRRAKEAGVPISAETCPHYLFFAAEDVPDGRTEFKCAPPIRERDNREALWAGLRDGTLECVVSDHSPCVPELKKLDRGDFLAAWGGIGGLQFGLRVVWTEARKRGFALADVVRWMCERPAELAGLRGKKGAIVAGADADLVAFDADADAEGVIARDEIAFKNAVSPYVGAQVRGRVVATYVRGRRVFDGSDLASEAGGAVLWRP